MAASEEQKEKARVRARLWYQEHRERALANVRAYKASHPTEVHQWQRGYYLRHRERQLAAEKKWREGKNEYYRCRAAADYKRNPLKWRLRNHNRRLAIRKGGVTSEQLLIKFSALEWRCYYCAVKLDAATVTIEHVIPLSRGGKHILENIVPACQPCNFSKNRRLIHEWRRREVK